MRCWALGGRSGQGSRAWGLGFEAQSLRPYTLRLKSPCLESQVEGFLVKGNLIVQVEGIMVQDLGGRVLVRMKVSRASVDFG